MLLIIDDRPLRTAIIALGGKGSRSKHGIRHLFTAQDTIVFGVGVQQNGFVLQTQFATSDSLFLLAEIVVVEHLRVRNDHLIVDPFYAYRPSVGIAHKQMVCPSNIGVNVVLLQQFERLLYVCRMVEQQSPE